MRRTAIVSARSVPSSEAGSGRRSTFPVRSPWRRNYGRGHGQPSRHEHRVDAPSLRLEKPGHVEAVGFEHVESPLILGGESGTLGRILNAVDAGVVVDHVRCLDPSGDPVT